MNREQMEATLLLHGWWQGATSGGNYCWAKEDRFVIGSSYRKAGGIFVLGPTFIKNIDRTDVLDVTYGVLREMFDRIVESKEGL